MTWEWLPPTLVLIVLVVGIYLTRPATAGAPSARASLVRRSPEMIASRLRQRAAGTAPAVYLSFAVRTAGTVLRTFTRRSDPARWRRADSLSPTWDSRTAQMAALISPGASVIEFGAGRQALRTLLPAGCTYVPCDLVDRGGGTRVVDLNARRLPRFGQYDVAVLSGVLEYVHDVPRLIDRLAADSSSAIVSYAAVDVQDPNQETGRDRLMRRSHGWVNDYTSREIMTMFTRAGFTCVHTGAWNDQEIYQFTRK